MWTNYLLNPEKVFSIQECGDNALEIIYGFTCGMVFSEYPIIPFDFNKVTVINKEKIREISDYNDLKEWWEKMMGKSEFKGRYDNISDLYFAF